MVLPVIVRELTEYIQNPEAQDSSFGVKLLCATCVIQMAQYYLGEHCFQNNLITGFMAQQSIENIILKKMMRMTAASSKNYEEGQIHGVKGQTGRLVGFVWELSDLAKTPLTFIYCSYRLFSEIGVAFISSVALLVLAIRIRKYLHQQLYELHFENGKIHEKMNTMTHESFENVRTIKLYGWSEYFREKILSLQQDVKEKENEIRLRNKVIGIVWDALTTFMNPLAFIVYFSLGGDLDLPRAMEVIMLLGQIQGPIHHFQNMQNQLTDLNMCMIRIQDFLAQPELVRNEAHAKAEHPDYAIYIENTNFSWGIKTKDIDEIFEKMAMDMRGETQEERDSRKSKKQIEEEIERKMKKEEERKKQRKLDSIVCLKDITLKIKKGQFVCIIGKVGSGKSSLLSTMCGELLEIPQQLVDNFKGDKDMDKELDDMEALALQEEMMRISAVHKGCEVNGSIAYTAQTPWIRNRTVRENIVYDKEFDLDKYIDTVQYCEFERDIVMQREGDQTMIGDRGVTLSGG